MYEENVKRGALLLDRLHPGWARKIDVRRLAMKTCDRCILGQFHGQYFAGCRQLAAQLPDTFLFSSVDHGFTIPEPEQMGEYSIVNTRFRALAAAWKSEIRARNARKTSVKPTSVSPGPG